MFCSKCGNQSLVEATFCQKCGAKLTVDDNTQQTVLESEQAVTPMYIEPTPLDVSVDPISTITSEPPVHTPSQMPNIQKKEPKKKKSKKLPIIFGIVAVIFILFIIIVANLDDTTPTQSNTDGNDSSSSTSTQEVNLSETYTNEAEGIEFRYPKGWAVDNNPMDSEISEFYNDNELEKQIVLLANEQDPQVGSSYISIFKFSPGTEVIDQFFSYVESDFEKLLNADGRKYKDAKVTSLTETNIDDTPAKMLTFKMDGGYCRRYYYAIDSNLYMIDFLCVPEKQENLEPFFDAIMDSYTITPPVESSNSVELSETYTNETEGIEFNYPSNWTVDEYSDGLMIAFLKYTADSLEFSSAMTVAKGSSNKTEIDKIFSADASDFEEIIEEKLGINISVTQLSDVTLDGVPAKKAIFTNEDGLYSCSYNYALDTTLYETSFICSTSQAESFQPLFDAIMETYTIIDVASEIVAETSSSTTNTLTIDEATKLVEDWMVVNPLGDGNITVKYIDDPNSTLNDGSPCYAFDLFSAADDWFISILVDKETGEMFQYAYGEEQPLDEWYQEFNAVTEGGHGGGNEGMEDSTEEYYEEAPVIIDNNFEWVKEHIVQTDYSTFPSQRIVGEVRNITNTTFSVVTIEFILYDSSGNQVGTASDSITSLIGGNTWSFEAPVYDERATSYEFAKIIAF